MLTLNIYLMNNGKTASNCFCLANGQLINTVEFVSLYSKSNLSVFIPGSIYKTEAEAPHSVCAWLHAAPEGAELS